MPDRATLEPHVRRAVRDLLDRAPAYRKLADDERRKLVDGLVDVGGTLALEDADRATDLPGFVAGLVEGTFAAVVDASVQQLQAYAELVHAVSVDEDDPPRIRERLAAHARPARAGVMPGRIKWSP
jgi:hypothetical protein